jgi:hypothetical protein
MFCSCAGWFNGRSCSLKFSWRKNYSCVQEQSWFWMDSVFCLSASPPRDRGWHRENCYKWCQHRNKS